MEVRERRSSVLGEQEQVHELSVVFDQLGQLPNPARAEPADVVPLDPRRVSDGEQELRLPFAGLDASSDLQRPVQAAREVCIFSAPPRRGAGHGEDEHHACARYGEARPPSTLRIGLLAGRQHALAHRRSHDGEHA
jgi:hypothetical protein